MKKAHYEEDTKKLIGWYDSSIHNNIPIPNIEISENEWEKAISINANHLLEDGTLDIVDFRTQDELNSIAESEVKQAKLLSLSNLTVTTTIGNTFDANDISRQDMLSAIDASATLNITEHNWKMANNEWVLISLSELKEASALAIQAKGAILAGDTK